MTEEKLEPGLVHAYLWMEVTHPLCYNLWQGFLLGFQLLLYYLGGS